MKLLQCLPFEIAQAVKFHINNVQELRLRVGQAVRIKVSGQWFNLSSEGQLNTAITKQTLTVSSEQISQFILNACDKSIYSVEKQLTEGFLTLEDGCRIGVSGKVSTDTNGNVVCFSRFSSVCIRVARSINCSQDTVGDTQLLNNILVVGQPSAGKTTFLRDLSSRASSKYNVVVVDERGELSGCERNQLDGADVLSFATKSYGLNVAVRSLSPDILAVDELSQGDYSSVKLAMDSGVKLYATLHGDSVKSVERVLNDGIVFDYYVILSKKCGEKAQLLSKTDICKIL